MGETPEETFEHWATKEFNVMGVPQVYMFVPGEPDGRVIKSRSVVPLIKEITT